MTYHTSFANGKDRRGLLDPTTVATVISDGFRQQAKLRPDPDQPELPLNLPRKIRRSRERGQTVRALMILTGRSKAFCDQLLKVIERGDPLLVAMVMFKELSVNRAVSCLQF